MDEKGKSRGISRREFLKDAGLVVGGAAVGAAITYPLVPKEVVKEVIKEVEVTKYKCPYCGVTVDTFDALKAHVTAQHPAEAIPEEVAKYVCPYCSAEFDTFGALKGHVAAEHPPEVGVVEPAFEPETTTIQMPVTPVAVDVKHGKIVRVRPVHYDSKYPDLKPWTITAGGQTYTAPLKSALSAVWTGYKKRVYSPNRILYPLKRVDWEPGGDPAKINAQNRGKSKFKRISWDEATDIIASELTRVADTYGPEAIFNSLDKSHGERNNVPGGHSSPKAFLHYWALSKYKAPVTQMYRGGTSVAGRQVGGVFVWSGPRGFLNAVPKDIAENTELLLGWGANGAGNQYVDSATGIIVADMIDWLKRLGIPQVYISPDLNRTAGKWNDKWIPVLPLTDGALQLAVAYTWIEEDTYAKDYVETHSVGFDKWKAYVMGDEDGIPKTPEWASPLCGVPEWTIKALARQYASKVTSVMHGTSGGGICRAPYSSELTRMEYYLLAMQGMGAPGRTLFNPAGLIPHAPNKPHPGGVKFESRIFAAMAENLGIRLSGKDRDRQFIPRTAFDECILNPPVNYWMTGDAFYKRTYPMEGFSEIHLLWGTSCAWTGGRGGGFRKMKAMQSPKIECVVHEGLWFEGDKYGDIILPVASIYETWDIDTTEENDSFGSLFLMPPAVEPMGESKTDAQCCIEIAKKLGFGDEISLGKSDADWVREGFETSGVAEVMSWEEFNEKQYFCTEMDPDWAEEPSGWLGFYNDPVANPLRTSTGLIEFESQALLENFPDDKERPPVAHWVRGGPAAEGWSHDEDLSSERAKKYPLLVCCNVKTWGEHSMHIDIPWTREIEKIIGWDGYWYSPIWIHPLDAAPRGIEHGDIVMIYNERGTVLGGAFLTEKIMPGSIQMDQGGGFDDIAPCEINRGGNPNAICPGKPISPHADGLACYGWLVELEKVTGNQMDEWRKNYPEAFERPYDPACGEVFSGWVEGGN